MAEKQLNLFPDKNKSKLKINPNATPETNLGDFQEQGGYQDEKKTLRDLNPRRKGTPVVRGKKAKEKQTTDSKQKAIDDWRREQGLEGTKVLPPWANAFRPNLKSLAIGTGLFGIEALKILNPFKPSRLY